MSRQRCRRTQRSSTSTARRRRWPRDARLERHVVVEIVGEAAARRGTATGASATAAATARSAAAAARLAGEVVIAAAPILARAAAGSATLAAAGSVEHHQLGVEALQHDFGRIAI